MKRKKLVLLLPHLDLGGGARRTQAYCALLPKFGWEVSVVIRADQVLRDLDTIIGTKTPRLVSADQEKIAQFMWDQKPTAIYSFYDGNFNQNLYDLVRAARQRQIKVVLNNVFSYFDERMVAECDRIIFQSKHMGLVKYAQALPDSMPVPLNILSLLHNPVFPEYLQQFALTKTEQQKLRRKFGWDDTTCVVGRFGREDIVKWGDHLVSAIWALRNEKNIAFLLVGVPASRKLVLETMCHLEPALQDRIKILHSTKDDQQLMSWMQVCDVIGHSVNIGEGWSNAINEALYWGKPVITTSTPHCDNGQTEQVLHQHNGFIAQTTNEWVATIKQLAQDSKLRHQLGKNGKKMATQLLDANVIVKRFAAILDDVVADTIKLTITRQEYQEYVRWYKKLLAQHPIYKPNSIWYKTAILLRRISNYLEHRWSYGKPA